MQRPESDAWSGHADARRDAVAVRRVAGPVRGSVARQLAGRVAGHQPGPGVELNAASASET